MLSCRELHVWCPSEQLWAWNAVLVLNSPSGRWPQMTLSWRFEGWRKLFLNPCQQCQRPCCCCVLFVWNCECPFLRCVFVCLCEATERFLVVTLGGFCLKMNAENTRPHRRAAGRSTAGRFSAAYKADCLNLPLSPAGWYKTHQILHWSSQTALKLPWSIIKSISS